MNNERFTVMNVGKQGGAQWGIYDYFGGSSPILVAPDRRVAEATAAVLNQFPHVYNAAMEARDAE